MPDNPIGVAQRGRSVSSFVTGIRDFVRKWFWQLAVAILVMAFILIVVRPFDRVSDPSAEDVAEAWNASIQRLGILPVFPPEEDLHVGDIWAVVADADDRPLLGKAVRLHHIDMRRELLEANRGLPIFADTTKPVGVDGLPSQDLKEVQVDNAARDERIGLTLTAFPGITINHSTRSAGSLGWGIGSLGAQRDDDSVEEIRIRTAETYGVPAVVGVLRLDKWCDENKIYCTDEFIRRIMAYSVSERLLRINTSDQYTTRLQLRLVTRVFLTREIEHRRLWTGSRGGVAQFTVEPTKSNAEPSTPNVGAKSPETSKDARSGAALNDLAQSVNSVAAGSKSGATTTTLQSDGTVVSLHQIFQRPVVIGYRAVTIAIPPSQPQREVLPTYQAQ